MLDHAQLDVRFAEAKEAEALHRFGYASSCGTRVRVLLALRQSPATSSRIAQMLGISRQMVSNQLACLRNCGLVSSVREGRNQRYRLADPLIDQALDAMAQAASALSARQGPAKSTPAMNRRPARASATLENEATSTRVKTVQFS